MTNELVLTRGDTTTYKVTVMNNGSAFDLTGYTCSFTAKTNKTDLNDEAIIGPVIGTVSAPTSGIIDFTITQELSSVDEGVYYYDVELNDTVNVFTVINSTITVTLDVTK